MMWMLSKLRNNNNNKVVVVLIAFVVVWQNIRDSFSSLLLAADDNNHNLLDGPTTIETKTTTTTQLICISEEHGPCCTTWDNIDTKWRTNHADWKLSFENETTVCFSRRSSQEEDNNNRIEIEGKKTPAKTATAATFAANNNNNNEKMIVCMPWNGGNTDDWWQDHPDWEVSYGDENATHTCFIPMRNKTKAEFFRQLHQVQFHGNCSEVQHRFLVGSGFAASFNYFRPVFWSAFMRGVPFQRSKHYRPFKWIYAPHYNESYPKENSWAACETRDMFCYFLDLSKCDYTEKVEHRPNNSLVKNIDNNPLWKQQYDWLLSYMLRPRHIVRKYVYEWLQNTTNAPQIIPNDTKIFCTAMHVRRTDATTEQSKHKRNFYPLQMYLDEGNVTKGSNILLLTDDQSTIEEAHLLHPHYNWYYINRYRLRGNHGKNKHIPSGDQAMEVIHILAEFRLVQQCDTLIHGTSHMVRFFQHFMQETNPRIYNSNGNYHVRTIQIDKDIKKQPSIAAEVFMKELDQKLLEYNNNKTLL